MQKEFYNIFLKFEWKVLEEKNDMLITYYDMPITKIRAVQGECVIEKSPREVTQSQYK